MKEHKRIKPGKTYKWTVDGHTFIGTASEPILINGVWHTMLENVSIGVSATVPTSQVRP